MTRSTTRQHLRNLRQAERAEIISGKARQDWPAACDMFVKFGKTHLRDSMENVGQVFCDFVVDFQTRQPDKTKRQIRTDIKNMKDALMRAKQKKERDEQIKRAEEYNAHKAAKKAKQGNRFFRRGVA